MKKQKTKTTPPQKNPKKPQKQKTIKKKQLGAIVIFL